MANFILIVFCMAAGLALRASHKLHDSTPHILNTFVIYLSFPALVLVQTPALLSNTVIDQKLLIPVSMAWLLFLMSLGFFEILGRKFGWSRATTGAVVLTAGLGNTSFVGFPLLEALYGPDAVRLGIIIDQAGSFLVLSTLGLVCATLYSGAKATPSIVFRRVFTFPPFLALVASCLLFAFNVSIPETGKAALTKLGGTLVPLALVSVGYQLKVNRHLLKRRWMPLSAGLGYKLLLAPALLTLLYVGVFGSRDLSTQITLVEAAMAPMITAAVVASEFHLDSELANLMVGVGIPISLLSAPAWSWALSHWL